MTKTDYRFFTRLGLTSVEFEQFERTEMQVSALTAPTTQPKTSEQLWEAAKELEAVFLAEMLKTAGFGKPLEGFGGGIGEEQFSSVLVDHQARAFADRGGIGLAERIFEAMAERAK